MTKSTWGKITSLLLAICIIMSSGISVSANEQAEGCGFVVGPYLLAPKANSMVLMFEGVDSKQAVLNYNEIGKDVKTITLNSYDGEVYKDEPMHMYKYKFTDLKPSTMYEYSVSLADGNMKKGSFRTLSDDPKQLNFMVISDSHKFETSAVVSDFAMQKRPDFILHTGDMVEGTGTQKEQFAFWFNNGTEFINNIPIIYNSGNHDFGPYFDEYVTKVQKEEYYSSESGRDIAFNYAGVHFTMMDSNLWSLFELNAEAGGQMADEHTHKAVIDSLNWLKKDLNRKEAKDADFRVLTMHHPYEDNYTKKYIPEIAEANDVNILFAGHTHVYTRATSLNPEIGARTLYVTQGDARIGNYKLKLGVEDARLDSNRPEVLATGKGDILNVTVKDGIMTYENLGLKDGEQKVVESIDISKEKPEIELSNISISPSEISCNEEVTVTATATNKGRGIAAVVLNVMDNGTSKFLYNFGQEGKERVVDLQPGQTKTVTAKLKLSEVGKHHLMLGDFDEQINVLFREATFNSDDIRVKLGDGEISNLRSDIMNVQANVTNIGNETGMKYVKLFVDGVSVQTKQLKLKAGETKMIEFRYEFEKAGEYSIKIGNSIEKEVCIAGTIGGMPIVKDQSGKQNNAIIHGSPELVSFEKGNGLSLDGVRDYIEILDNENYYVNDGVTGIVWANIDRVANDGEWDHNPLLMKGVSISYGTNYLYRMAVRQTGKLTYGIGFDNDNGEYFWNDDDDDAYGAKLGKWTQYTGAFNRAEGGISYQDNMISGKIDAPSYDSEIRNWVGASMYAGASFHKHLLNNRNRGKYHTMLTGDIGTIRFYTDKLTKDEVNSLYMNPSENNIKSDELAVWLDFDEEDIMNKGIHITNWMELDSVDKLEYEAFVGGQAYIIANIEVSNDAKEVIDSKRVKLMNGKGEFDISELKDAKYVRVETLFRSDLNEKESYIPKLMSYNLIGNNNNISLATVADFDKGEYIDACGFESLDIFKDYEKDFDEYDMEK